MTLNGFAHSISNRAASYDSVHITFLYMKTHSLLMFVLSPTAVYNMNLVCCDFSVLHLVSVGSQVPLDPHQSYSGIGDFRLHCEGLT